MPHIESGRVHLSPAAALGDEETRVVVAKVDISNSAAYSGLAARLLSSEENRRAAAFISDEIRSTFILAHLLKRLVLAELLQQAPERLVFARRSGGKESLVGFDLHHNISHSGRFAAVCVSGSAPCGIDIEERRDYQRYARVIPASLTDEEKASVAVAKDATLAFLKLWTAKEAYIKATGEGLRRSLSDLQVGFKGKTSISGYGVRPHLMSSTVAENFVVCACSLSGNSKHYFSYLPRYRFFNATGRNSKSPGLRDAPMVSSPTC